MADSPDIVNSSDAEDLAENPDIVEITAPPRSARLHGQHPLGRGDIDGEAGTPEHLETFAIDSAWE